MLNTRFAAPAPSSLARSSRRLSVLAFESSADDTCAAIVTSDRKILSNVVLKQHHLHRQFGGIEPLTAIDAHHRNMPHAIELVLSQANMKIQDVDGVAFTRGPGMHGCLFVGAMAAKALAAAHQKPIVGVHHMQAHALTPLLTSPSKSRPKFPYMALLVSGGHTMIILVASNTSFKIIANTIDRGVGAAIDHIARELGISPGDKGYGAALEQFCLTPHDGNIPILEPLNKPFLGLKFSFCGIQSAFTQHLISKDGIHNIPMPHRIALARSVQTTIFDQLIEKVLLGLNWCRKRGYVVEHLVLSGGVASNVTLRHKLKDALAQSDRYFAVELVSPPIALCTDNAAMIAWAAMHRFFDNDIDKYTVEVRPKWSIEDVQLIRPQEVTA